MVQTTERMNIGEEAEQAEYTLGFGVSDLLNQYTLQQEPHRSRNRHGHARQKCEVSLPIPPIWRY